MMSELLSWPQALLESFNTLSAFSLLELNDKLPGNGGEFCENRLIGQRSTRHLSGDVEGEFCENRLNGRRSPRHLSGDVGEKSRCFLFKGGVSEKELSRRVEHRWPGEDEIGVAKLKVHPSWWRDCNGVSDRSCSPHALTHITVNRHVHALTTPFLSTTSKIP